MTVFLWIDQMIVFHFIGYQFGMIALSEIVDDECLGELVILSYDMSSVRHQAIVKVTMDD